MPATGYKDLGDSTDQAHQLIYTKRYIPNGMETGGSFTSIEEGGPKRQEKLQTSELPGSSFKSS